MRRHRQQATSTPVPGPHKRPIEWIPAVRTQTMTWVLPSLQRQRKSSARRYRSTGVATLAPRTGSIVGHGQRKQNQEEKQARDHYHFGKFLACALDMHEEQSDKNRFERGNRESNGSIKGAKIKKRSPDSQSGAKK